MEKGVSIPPGGATCKSGLVTVRVVNIGSTSTVTDSDIIVAQINGVECTKSALSITPGQAGVIISDKGCGAGCAATTACTGKASVKVGTRNGVVDSSAICD